MLIVLAPAVGVSQTVAGFCNTTIGTGLNDLKGPWGIYVSPSDGNLYVADWDLRRYQVYPAFSRTGYTIYSSGVTQAMDIFVDNSNTIYMTEAVTMNGLVYIKRTGANVTTYPATGASINSCVLTSLYSPYGIAVDRFGNTYVSLYWCYSVVKWIPNASISEIIAGQHGISGTTANRFGGVRFIHLDEDRNALYVSDYYNNRIQRFIIGGNGTGVTVAGSLTSGIALNRLYSPGGICVTRDGQTLYVADYGNHRIMKWVIGASQGSVVAGSATGVAGSTSQLLNGPSDVALDPTESYIYVADYNNHRIQRFRLH